MASLSSPWVPVSWGELLDKITILQIKREHIGDPACKANVLTELEQLKRVGAPALEHDGVPALLAQLKAVNEQLWAIEDAIRQEEQVGRFGPRFIALARSVYRENDRRAAFKRELNRLLKSELVEEKSYWCAPAAELELALET
jgi:hypothetical protein